MSKKKRKCPYCESKVSYIKSLTEISSGEHFCPECNKYSNITFDKKIYLSAGILLLAAIILAAVMFFSDFSEHMLLKLGVTILPFVIFFFMIPLYFRLTSIKSEALKPTVISKSTGKAKNNSITGSNDKAQERYNVDNNGSFKNKFQKFIRTYIIVDDDDEETAVKSVKKEKAVKPEKEKKYKDEFGSFDDDVIIEEDFSADTEEDVLIDNIDIDEEYVDDDDSRIFAEDDDDDDVVILEETPDMSAFKRPQPAPEKEIRTIEKNERPAIEEKEEKPVRISDNEINEIKPVYHKFTKTDKVNYVYFPSDLDVIGYEMMRDPEPEIDEEEQENEEILNFFDSAPSKEDEEEFGENKNRKVEVSFNKKEADEIETIEDSDTEEDNSLEFEYFPESQSTIEIDISEDDKTDDNEEIVFSESADEAEDAVAETPDIMSDHTDSQDVELKFDFGDDEESASSVEASEILSYNEEFEVTGDVSEIPVITHESRERETENSDAEKKYIPIITQAKLEDEDSNDNDPIEFGEKFDEIFDFMPVQDQEADEQEVEENTEEGMKLVEVSDHSDDADVQKESDEKENDNIPTEEEDLSEENDSEPVEGAVEYIPEEKSLEKTKVFSKVESDDDYVVDYSEDETDEKSEDEVYDELFEEDDEEIDFSGYQTSSYTEEEPEKTKEDESITENTAAEIIEKEKKIEKEKDHEKPVEVKQSKYEKKFPKAAKAAAAVVPKKKVVDTAEVKETEDKKPVSEKSPAKKKKKLKSKGFFSALKEKIVEATEEERNAAFEQEEEERRQAEKEARRKAKEKAKAEKEKINSQTTKKKSK